MPSPVPDPVCSTPDATSILESVITLEESYLQTWGPENVDERIEILTAFLNLVEPLLPFREELEDGSTQALTELELPRKCTIALMLEAPEPTHTYDVSPEWKGLPVNARRMLRLPRGGLSILVPSPDTTAATSFSMEQGRQKLAWLKLALAFQNRFDHTQDIQELHSQLTCATCALVLTPAYQDETLLHIGSALFAIHELRSQDNNILSAIAILDYARRASAKNSSNLPWILFELGRARLRYFQERGNQADLDASRDLLCDSFDYTDTGHPCRCRVARTLVTVYCLEYQIRGSIKNSQDPVCLADEAVRLCPPGHIYRPFALQGLSVAFSERYRRTGQPSDLIQSIKLQQEILTLLPLPNHPLRLRVLSNMCAAHGQRFEQTNNIKDLYSAIDIGQQVLALGLCEPPPLANLGNHLRKRYFLEGNINDLELAMTYLRRALELCRPGHPFKVIAAINLGICLLYRFWHTSDLADVEEAITTLRSMIANTGPNYRDMVQAQITLAQALKLRFLRLLNLDDLYEARAYLTAWLEQRASGNDVVFKSEYLRQAAEVLLLHFKQSRDLQDLHDAIDLLEEETAIDHEDSPYRYIGLHHLASAYCIRAEETNSFTDAEKALSLQLQVLASTHNGNQARATVLSGMAKLQICQALPRRDTRAAIEFYYDAVTNNGSSAHARLAEGLEVLCLLQSAVSHESSADLIDLQAHLLQAYRATVHLFPQIAYFGLDVRARLNALARAPHLAADAATYALQLSKPEVAIEILEEGRAVFWMQYSRLRTSFDQLPSDLGDELRNAAQELEIGAMQVDTLSRSSAHENSLHEKQVAQRRRLSERFEQLIATARSIPGLERFMLNDTFSALSVAAQFTSVVVLVATSGYCGAIILRDPTSSPEQIAFTSKTGAQRLNGINRTMHHACQMKRRSPISRAIIRHPPQGQDLSSALLSEIWHEIMEPIIRSLGYKKGTGRNRPRLMLCATGPFTHIPLHAACTPVEGCWDYFVPSYTPTLGVLLTLRKGFTPIYRNRAKVLLATVPLPFKWSPLAQTITEAQQVTEVLPSHLLTSFSSNARGLAHASASASAADVLDNLASASILHLACHGCLDPANPLNSGFVMRDKMLTVTRLMELNLPHAFFAFLSACDTAKADRGQPDQAVHLAATMLFVGFKSVIGTMWSMDDVDGPVVAKKVYEELFAGDEELFNPNSIPYALDAALQQLRKQNLQPARWAPYVHFGV